MMMNDLRFALRLMLKSPGFSLLAILTLALGIGANSAIFSVVNALLLRPLPLQDPAQLVRVYETQKLPAGFRGSASAANLRDWQEQNSVLSGLAAFQYQNFALLGRESPQRLLGAMVSANYFRVLGAQPLLGRTFVDGEDKADAGSPVVISEALWHSQFAGDPNIVSQKISLDGHQATVVGVMPQSFRFPSSRNQVWTPLVISPAALAARGSHGLEVIGRLRPGITLAQAQANMETIARGIAEKFPEEQGTRNVLLVPLQEEMTRHSRTGLLVLLGSVLSVLLIASTNIANLLLARTTGRRREIALRLALGASRTRLVRLLLSESILLAIFGGVAGILTAIWGIDLLTAFLGSTVPATAEVRLDGAVLAFTAAIALFVGIACGLAPARQVIGSSSDDLQTALHGHSALAGTDRIRSFFVVGQLALAVVLLASAGLLLRSFAKLQRADSGLRQPEQVLTARVSLPAERYPSSTSVADFYQRALGQIQNLAGVRNAGAINLLPLQEWGMNGDVELEGHPLPAGQAPLAEFRATGGDYFATMGVSLLTGRLLDARDGANAPRAIVINRALVRQFSQTENGILGNKIKIGDESFTIVGVVADVRQSGLDSLPRPEIYFPLAQALRGADPGQALAQAGTFVVRASVADPASLAKSIRSAVSSVDPGLPLFHLETLQGVIADSVVDRRANSALLATFAAVALLLAAMGLYGVISYAVTQRTREFGIRVALGARHRDLYRLVMGRGMKLVALGLGLGLLGTFGLTRFLASMLYGVSATDPLTFAMVIAGLSAVALLANFLPARRAARVNPIVALRYE